MFLDRRGKSREVVPPFQDRDDTPAAVIVGGLPHDAGQAGETFLCDPHAGEGIVAVGIEAGRDQDRLGAESIEGWAQLIPKYVDVLGVPAPRRKGRVQRAVNPFAATPLTPISGAGVEGELVDAEVEDGPVLLEQVLGPVSVMNVPVDDGDPA